MLLMAKEELVYARISTELKRKLQMAMSQRGEAEAVIIREALNLYFAHLDRTATPVPQPPALRETPTTYNTSNKLDLDRLSPAQLEQLRAQLNSTDAVRAAGAIAETAAHAAGASRESIAHKRATHAPKRPIARKTSPRPKP